MGLYTRPQTYRQTRGCLPGNMPATETALGRGFITSAEGKRLRLRLSVCLQCLQDYPKSCRKILRKLFERVGRCLRNNLLLVGGYLDYSLNSGLIQDFKRFYL